MGAEKSGSLNSSSVTVLAFAVFSGIYLLSRGYDKRRPSPNAGAVVREGAGKLLIVVSAVVAIILFVLILPSLGIGLGNIF